MGMAASQARLLTITARLADNELRSQTINNAKMRLATQSSQASENYINALNNATYKFASYDEAGNAISQDLTYNALTAYSSYNTQYGLINSAGQILVSESEAAMFTQANGNLNAYLLAHGLEYTTTYFDELGAIENGSYPDPFDVLDVEELKTAYEQYGSYENSLEVENFQNNYAVFMHAQNNLIKGSEASLESYLTHSTNPKLISSDENGFSLDFTGYSGLSNILNRFQSAFLTNNNTYNLNNLKNNGVISESLETELTSDKVNALKYVSNAPYTEDKELKYKGGIEVSEEAEFVTNPTSDDKKEYILDDGIKVLVDADGNITGIDMTELTSGLTEGETIVQTGPLDDDGNVVTSGVAFEDFVNGLSYKHTVPHDDGIGESVAEYFFAISKNAGGEYSLTSKRYIFSDAELIAELNSKTNDIISSVLTQANYENFADMLLHMSDTELQYYGIAIDKMIPNVGKTLGEILALYTTAKDTFLNTIFDDTEALASLGGLTSKAFVEQALKSGAVAFQDENGEDVLVTPENLTDIDFVLKYLNEKKLKQSESFNTVIKEFLVEEIMLVYGEPKYAWVDVNDTANTGNADAKAQWYTNLFNRMNQGFKALENGLASSKEWMEYALESGIVTLEQVDKNFKWNGLDYKTCIKITEETDEAAVTKAEAEYNRAMNDIEAKDNIYTLELKNIDTEHSALQTEYDVIKGVIDKNISRTFKFNQSA
ncbi:hypothetical protein IKL64_01610 [bacterium]|nr:hypothetical protein [bacterium]